MAAFGRGCIWTTAWPCSVVQQEMRKVIFWMNLDGTSGNEWSGVESASLETSDC